MSIFNIKSKAYAQGKNDKKGKHYFFEDYCFSAEHLQLTKAGVVVELKAQPARLLEVLLQNAPGIVSRQTLQDSIWDKGTLVEFDLGLNVCVNQLRSVLGDSAGKPSYIETLPKRGYRFIAEVQEKKDPERRLLFSITATLLLMLSICWVTFFRAEPVTPVSIYVAPVQVDGVENSELDSLAQYALRLGTVERLMHDERKVLTALNGVSLWEEPSRIQADATFDFSLFMTLSAGLDEYHVDVMIVDAKTKLEFNKKTFRSSALDVTSLARLADEVSTWSSGLFGAELEQSRQTSVEYQPVYFDAMINARRAFQLGDMDSLVSSLTWFNKALEVNPNSLEALGGKALVLAVLSGSQNYPTTSTYTNALLLADRIREQAGPTAQSELVRGFIYLYRDWDLIPARQAFDLAAELAPNDALVHAWRAAVLAAQGEIMAAAVSADTAVMLDPLAMSINADRCWYLSAAGRNEDAVAACNLVLGIDPGHFLSRISLAMVMERLGREQDAVDTLSPVLEFLKNQSQVESQTSKIVDQSLGELQLLYCEMTDLLTSFRQGASLPTFQSAAFNAQCGRYEMAAKLLMKAKQAGESGALFYAVDPRLGSFREQPIAQTIDMEIAIRY